jgi:chondroitin-sulfate-ABC endolyase/exolyase
LKSTPYELSTEAQQNIKGCLKIYPKISNDLEMSRALSGRFPSQTTPLLEFRTAFALSYATDPIGNLDMGKEFKRIYYIPGAGYDNGAFLALGEIVHNLVNDVAVAPATPLTGCFGFPYAGLSVYKFNGFQASVAGTSQYIINYETYGSDNQLGRYQASGAIELLTAGNPKSRVNNGLAVLANNRATTNGWDWVHVPGVTGESVTLAQLAIGTPNEFNGKRFLAHASLDNNGVFAMDYKDINSMPVGLSAYKTNFFYKDKILCLATGIKHTGSNAVHTTLFQTALATPTTTTLINGNVHTGLTDNFNQTGGSLWATDAVGNGFVIPASAFNTGEVMVARSTQTSRNDANTADTQGDYVKAYINHGVAPSNSGYRYAIMMQGNSSGTQDLANNFSTYFDVLQQDNKAHVVKFVGDDIYNYAIFDVTATFNQNAVKQVNKPCVVMTQVHNQADHLKVSLTNPDLGLLNDGEEYIHGQINRSADLFYSVPQVTPVKLTLYGKWALNAPTTDVSVIVNGNDTEVTFNTINGLTIQTELVKADVLAFGFTHEKAKNNEDCRTVLSWGFDAEGKDIASFSAQRSVDGANWQTVANWKGTKNNYVSPEIGNYFYRICATASSGEKTYSKTLTGNKAICALESNVTLYPNPTTTKSTLNLHGVKIGQVKVYDLAGKDLSSYVKLNLSGSFVEIDLTNLKSGVYILKAGKVIKKIVKQ